jgi:hypothetical protein
MTTKNHKPTTTSDILPATLSSEVLLTKEDPHSDRPSPSSPTNPPIQKSNNPFSLRARCGKVARLPKEIRDQLNEMLLDGVPHTKIIQILRDKFGPPATVESNVLHLAASPDAVAPTNSEPNAKQSDSAIPSSMQNQNGRTSLVSKIENFDLTPQHLTTWKRHGGYRDWLRDQQRIAECKLRHELTLDLARSAEGVASYQAAPKVAVAQICQTIIDIGPEGLKGAMKDSPLNCFRLLNALARLINSGLKCETHIQKTATAIENGQPQPLTRARLSQIETELNLL